MGILQFKRGHGSPTIPATHISEMYYDIDSRTLWQSNGSAWFAVSSSAGDTGGFATTGSNTFIGNQIISGNLTINGTINLSGSSGFATTGSNTFFGNQIVSGNIYVSGNINVNRVTADSIRIAGSAIFDDGGNVNFNNSVTPPFTVSSSNRVDFLNADLLDSMDSAQFATTGSNIFDGDQFVNGKISASSINASIYQAGGEKFAQLSGVDIHLGNIDALPVNVELIGNLASSSITLGVITSSYTASRHEFIGPIFGTISTASFSSTSSFANNSVMLDGTHSAVFATTGTNTFNGDQSVSGNLFITQSLVIGKTFINTTGSTPTAMDIVGNVIITGSLIVSASASVHIIGGGALFAPEIFVLSQSTFSDTLVSGTFIIQDSDLVRISASAFVVTTSLYSSAMLNGGTFATSHVGFNNFAGAIDQPTYVDNGDGTITIHDDGTCRLYKTDDLSGPMFDFEIIPSASFAIAPSILTYVLIQYNSISDSAIYTTTTNEPNINESSNSRLLTVFNLSNSLFIRATNHTGRGLANKLYHRIEDTEIFARERGFNLSVSGSSQVIEITDGVAWFGVTEHDIAAFKSDAGTSSLFITYHNGGGSFTSSLTTTASNVYYDDGIALQFIPSGGYNSVWVYKYVADNVQTNATYLLGSNSGSLADAQAADVPQVPDYINNFAILCGKIIFASGSPIPVAVENAFQTVFTATPVSSHGALSGLTADDHPQYLLLAGRGNGPQPIHGGVIVDGTEPRKFLQVSGTLSVTGALQYIDGNQNAGSILTSINNEGTASWSSTLLVSGTQVNISASLFTITASSYSAVKINSSSIATDDIGFNNDGGVISSPSYINNGDGTITINNDGIIKLYKAIDCMGPIFTYYNVPSTTLTITPNVSSVIFAKYDGVTDFAKYDITTDDDSLDAGNETRVFTVFYTPPLDVQVFSWFKTGLGLPNRLHGRILDTARIAREVGLNISVSGSSQVVELTDGQVWIGAVEVDLEAFKSDSGSNVFSITYHSGSGSFTSSLTTTASNEFFDDGTGLVALPSGGYNSIWVYKYFSDTRISSSTYVLGSNSGSLNDALTATVPQTPDSISNFSILVGRIIFQSGSTIPANVSTAFTTQFTPTVISIHGNLAGLGADDHKQYLLLFGRQPAQVVEGTVVLTDTLSVSGSLNVSQSITLTGSMHVSGAFQFVNGTQALGSFLTSDANGNATWIQTSSINVSTASFAISSSIALTASFVQTAQTASFVLTAQTASFVTLAQTASFVQNAQTASFVQNAVSSSFATTASFAQTASFISNAQTASFVQNAVSSSFAATASFIIGTISNATSASYASTASFVLLAQTASFVLTAQTASFVLTAQTASFVQNSVSSSFATTASFAITASSAISSSYAHTSSFAISASNAFTSSYAITASFAISASNAFTSSYARTASWSTPRTQLKILADNYTYSGDTAYHSVSGSTSEFTFNVEANSRYYYKFNITFSTANANTGIGFSVSGSCSSSSMNFGVITIGTLTANTAGFWGSYNGGSFDDGTVTTGVQTANNQYISVLEGYIVTVNAGTIVLRARSETNTANTIYSGTLGRVEKMEA